MYMQTRDNLRKQFTEFDSIVNDSEWPSAENAFNEIYYEFEEKVNSSSNAKLKSALSRIKFQVDRTIAKKDVDSAKQLKSEIGSLLFSMVEDEHGVDLWIDSIYDYNQKL